MTGTTVALHAARQSQHVWTIPLRNFTPPKKALVCLSWWCPCVVYGRTHHRVKNNGNMHNYSGWNLSVRFPYPAPKHC
jgi:hypothetical protein